MGELGWELHLASSDLAAVYAAIETSGAKYGLADFGSYALNAMRIEKGYHGWGSEIGTEYTPFDCGLERFVAFDKGDFVGRDAVLAARATTPEWCYRGFLVDSSDADPPASAPIRSGDTVVGYVTSASFGFRTGKRLALGFVRHEAGAIGSALDIEVLGVRCRAICIEPHVYDPGNRRLKS